MEEQKAGKVKGEKRQEKNNQLEMSKEKGKVLKLKMKEEGGIFGGGKERRKKLERNEKTGRKQKPETRGRDCVRMEYRNKR